MLSHSDDTGLEVDCKALLVASEPGTVPTGPVFFYADADRGGTDEPLDGELGLGADENIISGFRRRTTTLLQLTDHDNPVTFDLGAYFNTGGDGNDLTVYLQTTNDGEVSFPVAGNVPFLRANQVRFTLPAAAQTLLDNLADGDRWIFKTARPSVVAVTGSGEPGSAEASGIEGTGRAGAATQTGMGEAGTVAAEGVEGTGQAIPVVVRTGSGELGSVNAAGVEGEGGIVQSPYSDEQIFELGAFNGNNPWMGAILIDPVFVVGGGTAYLRQLQRSGNSTRLRLATTTTGNIDLAGPELIPAWETFEEAMLLERDGSDPLTLPGPDFSGNSFQ